MQDFAEWLQATPLTQGLQAAGWVVPTAQCVHIITIGVVFVSILMIALRVLGRVGVDQPLSEVVDRFSPWILIGLAVMAATGVVLVLAEPVREFFSSSFWVKMALLVVLAASSALFRRAVGTAKIAVGPGETAPGPLRSAAIATLVLWLAVIFFGRAIAYDIEVWGAWSLTAALR